MFIYQLLNSSLRIKKEDIHKPYMSESLLARICRQTLFVFMGRERNVHVWRSVKGCGVFPLVFYNVSGRDLQCLRKRFSRENYTIGVVKSTCCTTMGPKFGLSRAHIKRQACLRIPVIVALGYQRQKKLQSLPAI